MSKGRRGGVSPQILPSNRALAAPFCTFTRMKPVSECLVFLWHATPGVVTVISDGLLIHPQLLAAGLIKVITSLVVSLCGAKIYGSKEQKSSRGSAEVSQRNFNISSPCWSISSLLPSLRKGSN